MQNSIINFINTLVFAIVASTVSVGILFMIVANVFPEYFLMMIIVEIGLVCLIFWALASIVNYDVKGKTAADAAAVGNLNVSCPDYFKAVYDPTTGKIISCNGMGIELDNANTNKKYKYDMGQLASYGGTYGTACQNRSQNPPQFAWTSLTSKCDTLKLIGS